MASDEDLALRQFGQEAQVTVEGDAEVHGANDADFAVRVVCKRDPGAPLVVDLDVDEVAITTVQVNQPQSAVVSSGSPGWLTCTVVMSGCSFQLSVMMEMKPSHSAWPRVPM